MEIAQLDCGDFFIRDAISSLLVRNGKYGKRSLVRFSESLKAHLNEYISVSLQAQAIRCFCPAILAVI